MMGDVAFDPLIGEPMVCPTCKARQEWSDTCRRCKSDLGLFRLVAEACRASYRRALADLRAGRFRAALDAAERTHALCPNARSMRLLAVCRLLAGDPRGALAAARAEER